MGIRQRCENCVHGMVVRKGKTVPGRGEPVSAWCRCWKMDIPESRFKKLSNCLMFEKKEGM